MRENLAKACGIASSQVSVKATTEEGLGFTRQRGGHSGICCLPAGTGRQVSGSKTLLEAEKIFGFWERTPFPFGAAACYLGRRSFLLPVPGVTGRLSPA